MPTFELTTATWLPQPAEEVFAFFGDAANLDAMTPPWLQFRILTPMPVDMRRGAVIEYALRLRGVPVRWRTEITDWTPPVRFVDEQRRGPYRRWVHTHTFTPERGGTRVEDRVVYEVPGGRLVNRLFVAAELVRIFRFRAEALRGAFGVPATGAPVVSIRRLSRPL